MFSFSMENLICSHAGNCPPYKLWAAQRKAENKREGVAPIDIIYRNENGAYKCVALYDLFADSKTPLKKRVSSRYALACSELEELNMLDQIYKILNSRTE